MSRYTVSPAGEVRKCPKKCKCPKVVHYRTKREAETDARAGVVLKVQKDDSLSWVVDGVLHRGGNRPALVHPNGMMHWYHYGVIYRSARPLTKKERKKYGKKSPKHT